MEISGHTNVQRINGQYIVLDWGGENRRVYRWSFNLIFVPYLPYLKVSGVRFRVSGMMNRGPKSHFIWA